MTFALLSWLILLPIVGIFLIASVTKVRTSFIKVIAFITSILAFLFSLLLFVFFDNSTSKFQFLEYFDWLPSSNLHLFLGIDGISLFFINFSFFNFCVFCFGCFGFLHIFREHFDPDVYYNWSLGLKNEKNKSGISVFSLYVGGVGANVTSNFSHIF